jgi:hypothetical protein
MRVATGLSVRATRAPHPVVLLALTLIMAALPGSVRAQTATGVINGTVTDPKGLPIEGANVVIKDTDTNTESPVTTNDTGRYVAPLLQPDHYEVTVSKDGFATVQNKDISLIVGQTLTIDVQMPLQSQQGTVTVTAATPLIETEKTEQSQAVTEDLVSDLPTNSRRWQDFVLLTPGVTTDGFSGLSSFRGISGLYNNNSVDGANNSQAFFSESRGRASVVAYVYSPDSIREFQVSSSNYSAELGQAVGGTVNAVTKSGTNQFHGDAFWNVRYPSWNALDPATITNDVNSHLPVTQTVHQQNQFGGSLGGPILKDKLFFFATYDGFRKVNPIQYFSTSPAVTTLTCPSTTYVPAATCTNAMNFLLSQLGIAPRDLVQDIGFAKLDYQLNTANHLNALVNFQDWGEPFGYNTSYTVSNGGKGNNGTGATRERFVIASWDSTISNNMLNELRFQWGQDFEYDSANAPGPFFNIGNFIEYGETSALPRPAFPDENRYQVTDNYSLIKGPHTFKMGVDFNFIHEVLINLFQGDGSYSYTTAVALPAAAGCPATTQNTEFCDWLLDVAGVTDIPGDTRAGKHYSTFTQVTDPITHVGKDDFYDDDYAAFIQDTWKVRHNLTLNLGVRYDLQHVPPPPSPNTNTPLLAFYTSTLNIDRGDAAPRIGLAWNFANNTVLRLGFGTFFGKTSNSTYYALRVENGIYQQTISGCSPTASTAALRACAPVAPNVFFTPPGPALAAPFVGALTPTVGIPAPLPGAAGAVHGMPPDFVNPRALEGELTLEHRLPWNVSVSGTYLLTRGEHLPWDADANVAPSTTTRSYDVLNTAGTTVNTYTVPFYTTPLDPSTGIIQAQYSVVNSWYNAMVLTVRKPISSGIEILANYTLSHSLDDGETAGGVTSENTSGATFFGNDSVLNPYNRSEDYGNSDLDQRNRFVASVVWTPPYARNLSNKFERAALDGWILSGILTSASGQPFTPTIGTFTPTGGLAGGMTGAVIGTSASASGGRISWVARNSSTLPGWTNLDFRVAKTFTFRERFNFMVHAEAFNLFNSMIVEDLNPQEFTESAPGGTGCVGHTNACLVPFSSFQVPTTTSGPLLGARQLQVGARFEF